MQNATCFICLILSLGGTSYCQNYKQEIFYDNFMDNKNSWSIVDIPKQGSTSVTNGRYYLENFQKTGSFYTYRDLDINEAEDFEIEASIEKYEGVKTWGYGIVWGMKDPDNCYIFNIAEVGEFNISKFTNAKHTTIVNWEKSDAINMGYGSTNKLTIKKNNAKLNFYINDHKVSEINFPGFFGNKFGFSMNRNMKIAVDNLRISFHSNDKQLIQSNFSNTYSIKATTIDKRIALVIGNSEYENAGTLRNPVNDAFEMNQALVKVGFEVMEYYNLDQEEMKRVIDNFGLELISANVGLFFYAGHGIQAKGHNFLIPIDANLVSESDVEYDCIDAGRILGKMENANNRANIIILDACRDNPFERSWTRSTQGRGLASMDAPVGSIIAYATAPGTTASDGTGNNGLYTSALIENIAIPGLSIEDMFKQVRIAVINQSNGKQTPWESTSLTGNFYFHGLSANDLEGIENTQGTIDYKTSLSNVYFSTESRSTVKDTDGNIYETVQIGNQVWMAENLKVTHYSDGTAIPRIEDNKAWKKLGRTDKAYCWYDNNIANQNTCGCLYSWSGAMNGAASSDTNPSGVQGVCPDGWHLPSDAEWTLLIDLLGGESAAGGKLKESGTIYWTSPNTGATNESGYTALPGGFRNNRGVFNSVSDEAGFWTATESDAALAGAVAWSTTMRVCTGSTATRKTVFPCVV